MNQDSEVLKSIQIRVDSLMGLERFRNTVDLIAEFFCEKEISSTSAEEQKIYVLGVEDAVLVCLIHKHQDKTLEELRRSHNIGFFSGEKRTEIQKQTLRVTYEIMKKECV